MSTWLRSCVSACILAGAGLAASAHAADIAVEPLHDWTGYYVGGHGGVAFHDDDSEDLCDSIVRVTDPTGTEVDPECGEDTIPGDSGSPNEGESAGVIDLGNFLFAFFPDGGGDEDDHVFLAGAQIGRNWQDDRLVFGVEADFSFFFDDDDDGAGLELIVNAPGCCVDFLGAGEIESDQDWIATLRGRIGRVFGDEGRLLLYGTGGIAFTQASIEGSFEPDPCINCAVIGDSEFTGDEDDIKIGFAVGAGGEYAFNDWLSFGIEYLFVAFDDEEAKIIFEAEQDSSITFERDFNLDAHILRAKLNIKLGS